MANTSIPAKYVNLKFKNIFYATAAAALLAGCGSHSELHQEHHGEQVFKGQVTKVDYVFSRGVTILKDADGKVTELEGYPSIPCTEVEIYKFGEYEYEIFRIAKP